MSLVGAVANRGRSYAMAGAVIAALAVLFFFGLPALLSALSS